MATLERAEAGNRFGGPATLTQLEAMPDGDGQRYELIAGDIVLMAPPVRWHQVVTLQLLVQLAQPCEDRGLEVLDNTGVLMPGGTAMFIPDVVVFRAGSPVLDERYVAPSDVVLAVEIVSHSSRRHDRTVKPGVLADERVPYYMLVDPFPQPVHVTLFSLVDGVYEESVRIEAGQSLHLPEPFDLDLDTSKFA